MPTGWLYNFAGHDCPITFAGDNTKIDDTEENLAALNNYLYYLAWLSQNF